MVEMTDRKFHLECKLESEESNLELEPPSSGKEQRKSI